MEMLPTIRLTQVPAVAALLTAFVRMSLQSVDACACRGFSRSSERGPLLHRHRVATMGTGGWGRMTGVEYHPLAENGSRPQQAGSSVTGSAAMGLGNARH